MRRGLAPLELCLVLPLLMFLCALLIYAGTTFVWQVRGLNASRDVVWKARYPRSGFAPAPINWIDPATANLNDTEDYLPLDLPQIDHPVARGPLIGAEVNRDLLDPTLHPRRGQAALSKQLQIPPQGATLRFNLQHDLLHDSWTYPQMGMGGNVQQRIPVIYQLAKADPALVQRFIDAVVAIYYSPEMADLAPLDRESDFPRFGRGTPDFHPRLSSFSSLDVERIREQNVGPLLERIEQLPSRMTGSYLSLYRGALADLEAQLNTDPPPDPATAAAIQAELNALHAELDPYIEQLEAFQGSL